MAFINSEDIKTWRYKVANCVIINGDSATVIEPRCVVSIDIVNDYILNTFPIFKINLVLTDSKYYSILKNKNSLKVKLEIQKYGKYESRDNATIISKQYINDTFVTIMDDLDYNREKDLDLEKSLVSADPNDEEFSKNDNMLELYLYREEVANGIKKQINCVCSNATLSTVITYILGNAGIKNALVSPLENNKVYKELLLPPLTVNKLLGHLDAAYGFYKKGSIIFFGLDRSYILNFKGGCSVYETNEKKETCIMVPKLLSESAYMSGTVENNDDRHYFICNYTDISFENKSTTNNVINGTSTITTNIYGNKNTSDGKSNVIGTSNTKIVNNTGVNEWLAQTYTAFSNASSTVIYISVIDIDLAAITPNKNFVFVFEDNELSNKYKGNYLLTKSVFKFINDTSSGDFKILATLQFNKIL